MSRYIGICTILKCSPRLLEVFDRDTFVILHDLNLTLTSPGTDHSCEVDWVGGKIKDLRPEESDNHIEPIFGGVIFSFIKLIYQSDRFVVSFWVLQLFVVDEKNISI